jgi:ribonuclease HII
MSLSQRENWAPVIRAAACAWAVGFSSSLEIDQLGILPATRLAIRRALEQLQLAPQHLLLDYIRLPEIPLPQTALVKGDRRSLSIAAASVLAKTSRDQVLTNMEEEIPGYAFSRHKGYGTALHIQALEERGPTSQHRATFAPVRCAAEIIRSKEQEKW